MFSYSIGEQLMRSDTISSFNLLFATDTEDFLTCCMYPPIFYERHRTALKIVLDVRKDSRKVLQGREYACIYLYRLFQPGNPADDRFPLIRGNNNLLVIWNGPISGMERISVTSSMDIISPRLTISIRMRLTISELLRI